jgi:hypothetical protein
MPAHAWSRCAIDNPGDHECLRRPLQPTATPSGQLVATDGRSLPLVAATLAVTAGGGLARTRVVQRFRNRHQEPLTVTYQLPLPADGAVAAFAFRIGLRRIDGEALFHRRAELLLGARNSTRVGRNWSKLSRFFEWLDSVPFDYAAAEHHGILRTQLRLSGTPVGVDDM